MGFSLNPICIWVSTLRGKGYKWVRHMKEFEKSESFWGNNKFKAIKIIKGIRANYSNEIFLP